MRSRFRSSALLAAAAVLIAACGGSDDAASDTSSAPADTTPAVTDPPATDPPATDPPVTDPPATDPPATDPPVVEIEFGTGRGSYGVGVQTFTLPDFTGRERDLTVDVWFPLAEGTDGPLHQYTLIPGTYYESPTAITATPDAMATDGPFPLVVYSHGSGGLRYIHSDYTEAIASNGYIVAAVDHTGNTAADDLLGSRDEPEAIALNRPTDVTALIDGLLDPTRPETVGIVSNIDPEAIAVTGHSFGGFTAFATASGYDNSLGAYEADTRVDAIIPLAPAAGPQLLSDERLGSIEIPTLILVGTDDATTPIDPNVTRPWDLSAASPSYRGEFVAAEHETFTDLCDYLAFLPTLPEANEAVVETLEARDEAGCATDDMPIVRAKSLTNTLAVTFLDQIFKGGEPLTAELVDEQPDVIFQAKP